MMRSIHRTIQTVTALTLLSSGAYAANLYTAVAQGSYPAGPPRELSCSILNVSAKPITITVEARDYSANVITSAGPSTLNPGAAILLSDATGNSAYCHFLTSSAKKNVRAMAIYDNGSKYLMSIPAQ